MDITCVYENGLMSLYIDSNLVSTGVYNGPFAGSSTISNLTFGYSVQEPNERFSGLIDNVSVWSKALNQQDITQYLTCPPDGNEIDLVGHWNFEEGNGGTILDQTGNGNHGTINNAQYDSNVPAQLVN